MKIRQLPEDFVVEEVISPPEISSCFARRAAQYRFYLLEKRNITTLDAVEIISRIWKKKRQEISFCGLKDKYAYARQYLSIRSGPKKNLELHAFSLKYLGERNRNLEIGDLLKNHFQITIRDLRREEAKRLEQRADEVETFGYPNYFDYQRFGSVKPTGEFIAKYLIKKDYETALKYALAAPSKYDKRIKKNIRKTINQYWRDWEKIFSLIPRAPERSIINSLRDHPEEFKKAFELIDRNLRFLIVTSYQSYLWNEIVKLFLKKNLPVRRQAGAENILIPVKHKIENFILDLLFYLSLPKEKIEQWKDFSFPLPVHSVQPGKELGEIYEEVLAREDLTLRDFKLRGMKNTYFPKDERKLLILPEDLKIIKIENDSLNKNRLALTLRFSLPSGSYATILIKRLTYDF